MMELRNSRWLAGSLLVLSLGCGGGSPVAPPVVVSSPSPIPIPSPSPSPSPTDCPDGSCGNRNPVVRTQLSLYELFDEKRELVAAPDPIAGIVRDPIPVG